MPANRTHLDGGATMQKVICSVSLTTLFLFGGLAALGSEVSAQLACEDQAVTGPSVNERAPASLLQ